MCSLERLHRGLDMAGIKDVAEKSGVSISTVSYVMSGKRSVRTILSAR